MYLRIKWLIMTALNLSPDSEVLQKILRNRVLFVYYVEMIKQDLKLEWDRFKYLGALTNPEGYKAIEDQMMTPKYRNIFQQYNDGHEATEELKKLNLIQNNPEQQEGIITIG